MSAEPVFELIGQKAALEAYLDSQLCPSLPQQDSIYPQSREGSPGQTSRSPAEPTPFMTLDQQGEPIWPSKPFACQVIKTASLKLAIPLSGYFRYSSTISWPDNLTWKAGAHPATPGHLQYRGRTINIVDPARLVIPHERQAALLQNNNGQFASILLAEEQGWGLACDEVVEVTTIDPQMVRWRKANSKCLWVAGTVIQYGYALLDIDAISKLVRQG